MRSYSTFVNNYG